MTRIHGKNEQNILRLETLQKKLFLEADSLRGGLDES